MAEYNTDVKNMNFLTECPKCKRLVDIKLHGEWIDNCGECIHCDHVENERYSDEPM